MIDAGFRIISETLGGVCPGEQRVAATSSQANILGSGEDKHHLRVLNFNPPLHGKSTHTCPCTQLHVLAGEFLAVDRPLHFRTQPLAKFGAAHPGCAGRNDVRCSDAVHEQAVHGRFDPFRFAL